MGKYRVYFKDNKGRKFFTTCHTLAEARMEKAEGIKAGYTYIKTENITGKFLAMSGILLALAIIILVAFFDAFPLVFSVAIIGLVGHEILIRGGMENV